ncbi:MAG: NmrA family transcriptional regulator [Gammaproteobacteria bacterium]
MQNSKLEQKIPLILASNGKTSKRVVERFRLKGLHFREGSRTSEIPFDWYDASTWHQALQGIRSVYVVFYPDLAVPGAPEIIENFTQQAIICGVEHFVLLSGRGEVAAQKCEEIVMNSTLDWTIVRSSWFAQNFSENFFLNEIVQGQVFIPVGDIKEPFVNIDDLAEIVFAALTDDKHKGQIYELTGPSLMTFSDAISEIATATKRDITVHQVSIKDYVSFLREAQVPKEFISLLEYLFTEVLDGRNSSLTDGIQRALGREPRSFQNYVKNTVASGIWNVAN